MLIQCIPVSQPIFRSCTYWLSDPNPVHTVYSTPRIQIQRIPNPTHPHPSNLPHSNLPHPQSTTSAVHCILIQRFPIQGIPLQSTHTDSIQRMPIQQTPIVSPGPHPVPTALSSPLSIQRIPIQEGPYSPPWDFFLHCRTLFSAIWDSPLPLPAGLFFPLPDSFFVTDSLASPAMRLVEGLVSPGVCHRTVLYSLGINCNVRRQVLDTMQIDLTNGGTQLLNVYRVRGS